MRRLVFGNWPKSLADGFGFSLTTGSTRLLLRTSHSLVSIGTGGGKFGSIRAVVLPLALDATRARFIVLTSPPTNKPLDWRISMKRHRRHLPIPQFEFSFAADAFSLFSETSLDGDRLTRERVEAEEARRNAEAAQASLFARRKPKRRSRRLV
jgi:hypothetical protein